MITAATLATPMALFTRRSRSGWLDELDDIRGDALSQPSGEVASAMGDAHPLPEVAEDRSPLTELEAPLAPARSALSGSTEPHRAAAPHPTADPQPLAAELLRPPAVEPAAPVPAPVVVSTLPPPPPPGVRAAAEHSPAPVESVSAGPQTPPAASELPPPPASWPSSDEQPLPPASTQPAPHPVRPHEMWHPAVVASTPASPPVLSSAEEHVDSAELYEPEPEVTTSRFRFARLRPVLPLSETTPTASADASAGNGSDDGAAPPPYSLIEELLAPYGVASAEVDPETVGHGTAPYVPAVTPVAGSTLITGPVNRRTHRDDEFVRRRELSGARSSERAAPAVEVEPVDAPATDGPTPSLTDGPPPAAPVPEAPAAAPVVLEAPAPESVDPNHGSVELEAPTETAADVHAESVAASESEPAGPQVLPVAQNGTVEFEAGHLRLADEVRPEVVLDGDGVALTLTEGWCWTVLAAGHLAGPVVITMAAGTLTVPTGTSALAVVEADRTSFVVVVAGEASLAHPGGRLRLRPGAMALAPFGVEPQVDVASADEIQADPLVARNLGLDSAG